MRDLVLGGRYRLVEPIGEGGMGEVWQAEDETLGRSVAVKMVSVLAGGGSRGEDARARFLREARITARLQHPNIVTIHDLGAAEVEGATVPFLVMELVRGEGLDTVVRRGDATLADAARWGAQVGDALAEAHAAGIMHRDIKPSNVLVTSSGIVKVLDFGVARAADPQVTGDRLTQTGLIVGTPQYMAPEQARGFPEPASDLYALGCVLFELVTGELPFQSPDTVGYLSAHLTQQPPAPGTVRSGIPAAWDSLVLTLLSKEPGQRHPDATTVARALRQLDRSDAPTVRRAAPRVPSPRRREAPVPTAVDGAAAHPPTSRDRTRWLRFAPLAFFLTFLVTIDAGRVPYAPTLALLLLLVVVWIHTATLTASSGRVVRATGYVAVGVLVMGLVWDARWMMAYGWGSSIFSAITDSSFPGPAGLFLFLTGPLTVAAYCWREVSTRRARAAAHA